MDIEIRSNETKGPPRERVKMRWLTGFWLVSWAIWGPSVQAEVLYEKDGVQLRGTARIVARNAATCHVLEESHTEARYEELKGNDGQPLHVWQLEYSAHNQTGKALSYLRADFVIESAYPPCTNWTGEGPGGRGDGRTVLGRGVLGRPRQDPVGALWDGGRRGDAGGVVPGRVSHGRALL